MGATELFVRSGSERSGGGNWLPKKTARVCSDHFTPEAYKDSVFLKEAFGLSQPHFQRRLKEDAVPTVFNKACHPEAREKVVKRKAQQGAHKAHERRREFVIVTFQVAELTLRSGSEQSGVFLPEAGRAESSNRYDRSCQTDTTTWYSEAQEVQPQARDAYVQTVHGQNTKAVQTYVKKQSTGVQASPLPSRDSCDQTDDMLLYSDEVLREGRSLFSSSMNEANSPVVNLSRTNYSSDDISSSEDLDICTNKSSYICMMSSVLINADNETRVEALHFNEVGCRRTLTDSASVERLLQRFPPRVKKMDCGSSETEQRVIMRLHC
ncbi:hypothetical protein MRX96_019854 [Rhipicephalus microplus]